MIKMFGMCCPKKPKVSLDYIIKWIEEKDAIINELKEWQTIIDSQIGDIETWKAQVEGDITTRVVQAIEDYDWSTLPEEALSHKTDKVVGATEGNFASLDRSGNLLNSGFSSSSFALTNHTHDIITTSSQKARAFVGVSNEDTIGSITLFVTNDVTRPPETAVINVDNMPNLNRALTNPDTTPTSGSDNFVTSDTVYEALRNKSDVGHSHDTIFNGNTSISIDGDEGAISIAVANSDSGGDTTITPDNIENLDRALQDPDTTPRSGSAGLVTSGGVYTAISKKSDKEFCDKVYSRLMEFEKKSSVEYDITAIYDYGDSRPFLKVNGTDIIYEYDRTSEKITILHNVDYLYELAFVGDVFVIKDLTTGTSLGTARVEEFQTSPNRIKLSGLPLPANPSYIDKNIEIAITHGNY